jgi:trimethylamine--corrinoid protein Co-methyltransferase
MLTVEIARWLDLPNFGFAGTTDSQSVDAQMGLEIAELTLLVMQAGSNLNHDVGYLDFGLTGSLEQIAITDEYIGMNRRLLGGVPVTSETLALDVIAEVGAGGEFLTHDHTYRHLRETQWRPTLLNRKGRDKWEADGSVPMQERARHKVAAILAAHEPEPLSQALAARMAALIAGFQTP